MKKLICLAAAMVIAAFLNGSSAHAEPFTVDLSKKLPQEITVTAEDTIVFINAKVTVTNKTTEGQGELLKAEKAGKDESAKFFVTQAGSSELTVKRSLESAFSITRTEMIKLTVLPKPEVISYTHQITIYWSKDVNEEDVYVLLSGYVISDVQSYAPNAYTVTVETEEELYELMDHVRNQPDIDHVEEFEEID
ncbi:MAG: hypothetical protein K2W82_11370 [Candidatus Obscuribacterales bacterium]|nr:hypothetical protein [Candidatus Obscuribacterales bacterium]